MSSKLKKPCFQLTVVILICDSENSHFDGIRSIVLGTYSCNFDGGNLCGWSAKSDELVTLQWSVSRHSVNPLSGPDVDVSGKLIHSRTEYRLHTCNPLSTVKLIINN